MERIKQPSPLDLKNNKIKLSIVIPCFNEGENLPLLVKKIQLIKKDFCEIILVNNGSTDSTKFFLKDLKTDFKLRIVNLEKNLGYGGGILKGIEASIGEVISWTHSDLQTDLMDVLDCYKLYESKTDPKNFIIKGKRFDRNFFDVFFTFMMSLISSFFMGYRLSDINAQPKMFHRDFLNEFENVPTDFSLDLFLLYKAKKKNKIILEYPVKFNNRLYGESKGGGSIRGKIKLIIRTLKYIIKLNKNI